MPASKKSSSSKEEALESSESEYSETDSEDDSGPSSTQPAKKGGDGKKKAKKTKVKKVKTAKEKAKAKTKKKKKLAALKAPAAKGDSGFSTFINIIVFVPLLAIAAIEGIVAFETKIGEEDDGRSAGAVLRQLRTSRRQVEPRQLQRLASPADFAQLFRRGKVPMLSDLKGEFKAEVLDLGVQKYAKLSRLYVNNFFGPGTWTDVGFGSVGKGYNSFLDEKTGKRTRTRRFQYYTGKTSLVDEGQSVLMYYDSHGMNEDSFNRAMVCEVRMINENTLLGYGYMRWNKYTVFPFVLHRPPRGAARDVDYETETYTLFRMRVPLNEYWAKFRSYLPKWLGGKKLKVKKAKKERRSSKKAKKKKTAKKKKKTKKKRRSRDDNDDL